MFNLLLIDSFLYLLVSIVIYDTSSLIYYALVILNLRTPFFFENKIPFTYIAFGYQRLLSSMVYWLKLDSRFYYIYTYVKT